MTTKVTREQEPDASDASQHPTSEADSKGHETVHAAGDWILLVTAEGYVEAREDGGPYEGARYFTTRSTVWVPRGADYRYGKTIKDVLARYVHETRFERDGNEHRAALGDGIISALQSLATDATCGECGERATHVRHVNAPTGPNTAIVCDDHATENTCVTLYALANSPEQKESR